MGAWCAYCNDDPRERGRKCSKTTFPTEARICWLGFDTKPERLTIVLWIPVDRYAFSQTSIVTDDELTTLGSAAYAAATPAP